MNSDKIRYDTFVEGFIVLDYIDILWIWFGFVLIAGLLILVYYLDQKSKFLILHSEFRDLIQDFKRYGDTFKATTKRITGENQSLSEQLITTLAPVLLNSPLGQQLIGGLFKPPTTMLKKDETKDKSKDK